MYGIRCPNGKVSRFFNLFFPTLERFTGRFRHLRPGQRTRTVPLGKGRHHAAAGTDFTLRGEEPACIEYPLALYVGDRKLHADGRVKPNRAPELALAIHSGKPIGEAPGFPKQGDSQFPEESGLGFLHQCEVSGEMDESSGVRLGKRDSPVNDHWIGWILHELDENQVTVPKQ